MIPAHHYKQAVVPVLSELFHKRATRLPHHKSAAFSRMACFIAVYRRRLLPCNRQAALCQMFRWRPDIDHWTNLLVWSSDSAVKPQIYGPWFMDGGGISPSALPPYWTCSTVFIRRAVYLPVVVSSWPRNYSIWRNKRRLPPASVAMVCVETDLPLNASDASTNGTQPTVQVVRQSTMRRDSTQLPESL